jgi:fucose permease
MSTRELQKRFLRVFVTLVSVALMFGGPSYLIYGLQVVKVSYTIAVVIGLVSFVVGIFLFLRFAPKET